MKNATPIISSDSSQTTNAAWTTGCAWRAYSGAASSSKPIAPVT
jgi:hypothetical protein